MVVQCCVCKKIRIENIWQSADPTGPEIQAASHGYCPTCADDAFRELREYHRHNFRNFAPAKAVNS